MADGGSQTAFASAAAWDSHRAIITDLYQARNMPLTQVMQYMESRHGFKATMKMYKYRIKQWNLRKNLRAQDVEEFVRSKKTPEIRGAKASQERIEKYLRQRDRLTKKHDHVAQHTRSPLHDGRNPGVASSTALAVAAHNNTVRILKPPLFSPRSPDVLRALEGSIHAMRSYTSAHFDTKAWVLDSRGDLDVSKDPALEWHGTWYTVRHLMDAGKAKEAFRVVQKSNQVFEKVLASDSPTFFSSAFIVFLGLSGSWPDLAASVLRYMHSLSRIILKDSDHPMIELLSNIRKIEIGELPKYGRTLTNGSVAVIQDFFPFHSKIHVEAIIDAARDLFQLGIVDGDSAVSQILAIIRQLEASDGVDPYRILSAKRELTYVYLWKKDYTSALKTVSEILLPSNREVIKGMFTEPVSYRLLFQIHKELGNRQEAITACRKVVEFCVDRYGLADDFTIDNLSAFESYLRECGNIEEADQVKETLKGAMDELCSGIEELGVDSLDEAA
ncbi:uncharacterized protein JN550_010001 [Neoarthrinium moseri]|uniref:uncharacterized protein n=1 Tax=Neoarthrinium moseri TaxID=1658444 RepID=UPI001FDC934F|nr:uncharacterized protein JN550_010001 [Neoarthrinium moseri]KAI1862854.1 hypothetical protein JN550_010001 [Neoarthrinium moseri]